ncbi:DUF3179 domain-containing (seleno)protein [Aurantibacter sp.]|uniref:DUF3179 domain-containing (seleno)protein n=1 Tax=Aurantibacter sp. TaxID=2807103 RepID=UPI00326637F2
MKFKVLFIASILCISCSSENTAVTNIVETQEKYTSPWCVPEAEIGGGTSYFPLLESPVYKSISFISDLNILSENSKVAILSFGDNIFVYPYDFTNYYEVVDTPIDDDNFVFSYCPLTQSALCFDNNSESVSSLIMKASGYLYKDNLVLTDDIEEEYWSQMDSRVIRGTNKTNRIETYNLIETVWSVAKAKFSSANVFYHNNTSLCTGCEIEEISLNYNNLFGVINEHVKEDSVHLFSYDELANNAEIQTITVNGKKTIVVGNKNVPFFNAFYVPASLEFTLLNEIEFPLILLDNENTKWDVFGRAIEGPNTGNQLKSPICFIAGKWAWEDFYDNRILHF